ncbi:MAG: translation initiation factor IF-3 [Patescibacteria group bacterium]|nr:translation initiation factor IF-3 [Patescibacteria group bacterium]
MRVHPRHLHKKLIKKPLVNNQIRAPNVRLVDSDGKQLGIVPLEKALQVAKERSLDLVQITEKVDPPVCKIIDYGKYLYRLQKKEKKVKKSTEIKGIRLRFNISSHDLETRANQAEKFLEKGDLVKVEMLLRGRERGLQNFAREKMNQFIEVLRNRIPIKVERELRGGGRGLIMIISSDKKQETEDKK